MLLLNREFMIILKKNIEYKCDYKIITSVSNDKKEINDNSIFNLEILNTFKKDIKILKNFGIVINSDEKFRTTHEDLNVFQIIQINFLTFKDGRPFSLAKNLRKKKFKNEIRASGYILPDQYNFLLRCGFDSVEIEEDKKNLWLKILEMESEEKYQPF